jgi:hypothetical protein
MAVDSAGNVFVGDRNNHTLRKVTPAGVVRLTAVPAPGYYLGLWGGAASSDVNPLEAAEHADPLEHGSAVHRRGRDEPLGSLVPGSGALTEGERRQRPLCGYPDRLERNHVIRETRRSPTRGLVGVLRWGLKCWSYQPVENPFFRSSRRAPVAIQKKSN